MKENVYWPFWCDLTQTIAKMCVFAMSSTDYASGTQIVNICSGSISCVFSVQ